jgi:hypothetical protein
MSVRTQRKHESQSRWYRVEGSVENKAVTNGRYEYEQHFLHTEVCGSANLWHTHECWSAREPEAERQLVPEGGTNSPQGRT